MAMPSSLPPEPRIARRAVLGAGLALASLRGWAAQDADAEALLRKGGVVAAFRHALAPGTFDPPGFRLGDCSTQRNLNDEGRAQARSVGAWFQQRQLQPGKVLSSPWCRCVDSATLAFGTPQVWAALGSPRGSPETTGAAHRVNCVQRWPQRRYSPVVSKCGSPTCLCCPTWQIPTPARARG